MPKIICLIFANRARESEQGNAPKGFTCSLNNYNRQSLEDSHLQRNYSKHEFCPIRRAAIEAARIGDEGVDQITEAARRSRTAIEARKRSWWFETAERVREGYSHKGDGAASIMGRSRGIPELMLEH